MLGIIPAGLAESRDVRLRRSEQVEAIFDNLDEKAVLFQHLELANDGGLDEEVGRLYHHGRLIGSISTLVLVCLNIRVILRVDLMILQEARKGGVDRLNLTEIILRAGGMRSDYVAEQMVAYFEITVLVVLLFLASFYALNGLFQHKRFMRWICSARLFSEVLPELKHFSAMRLLQHVQPYLAQRELKAAVADLSDRRGQGEPTVRLGAEFVFWLAVRVLIFIFGFDAFIVKFRAAAECSAAPSLHSFLRTVLFLNQMLGVVSLERFTAKRLHQFVFGGEDNVISAGEARLLEAWTAKLFEKIWTEPSNGPIRAFAVSVTFNDEDFQHLMLNERHIEVLTTKAKKPSLERTMTCPSVVMPSPRGPEVATSDIGPFSEKAGRVDELRRFWQEPAKDGKVPVVNRSKTSPVLGGWRSRAVLQLPDPVVPPECLGTLL